MADSAIAGAAAPGSDEGAAADTAAWSVDGGVYHPVGEAVFADTLPAAPAEDPAEAGGVEQRSTPGDLAEGAPAARPVAVDVDGPVRGLAREVALARPLVAAVRGGTRLAFYSAWDSPPSSASLAGAWARVGSCEATLHLGYEQAVPGLGAVRGAGSAAAPPSWDVALVVPRQHCGAAAARWRAGRAPRPEEAALLSPLLAGEPPATVVMEGDRAWAASGRRAVAARITPGGAAERWSAEAPEGASMRLLGVWQGDGVWVAVEKGGRVLRVWRVAR